MGDRVMRVQGEGEASVPPDQVALRFDVSHWDRNYGPSIEGLNEHVDLLRQDMAGLGMERQQLKTSSFRVSTTHETVKRGGKEYRQQSGYTASHSIRLELPMDRDLMNQVLDAVSRGLAEPSVSIGFEVSDPAPLRQLALENGVAQARRNAETLAAAAGVSLKKIRSIEYGWAEMRVVSTHYMLEAPRAAGPASPDLEPRDVETSESVTVVWEIE